MAINNAERLFSYGTLRYESVQLATFGRKLIGSTDILAGYTLSHLKIKNPDVVTTSGDAIHPILISTNNQNVKACRDIEESCDVNFVKITHEPKVENTL